MTFSPHSTMDTFLATGDRIKNLSKCHGEGWSKWPAHDHPQPILDFGLLEGAQVRFTKPATSSR